MTQIVHELTPLSICVGVCTFRVTKIMHKVTQLPICVGLYTFRMTKNYAQGNKLVNLRGCMYICSDQKLWMRLHHSKYAWVEYEFEINKTQLLPHHFMYAQLVTIKIVYIKQKIVVDK